MKDRNHTVGRIIGGTTLIAMLTAFVVWYATSLFRAPPFSAGAIRVGFGFGCIV